MRINGVERNELLIDVGNNLWRLPCGKSGHRTGIPGSRASAARRGNFYPRGGPRWSHDASAIGCLARTWRRTRSSCPIPILGNHALLRPCSNQTSFTLVSNFRLVFNFKLVSAFHSFFSLSHSLLLLTNMSVMTKLTILIIKSKDNFVLVDY